MRFVWGLIIGFIAFPVLGMIYLLSGHAPAGVTDHPFPLEQYIAGAALESRIHHVAPTRDPSTFTAADVASGATQYRNHCGGCHGLPDVTRPGPRPVTYPQPPQLFTPDGYVTDDPVGVTYWKIENGIRMTGMPSFKDVLTDEQAWQIAALVQRADKLPPDVIEILKQPRVFPPPPPANGEQGAAAPKPGTPPKARK